MLTDILDYQLLMIGGTPVTVSTVLTASIILLMALIVSRGAQRAIHRVLGRRQFATKLRPDTLARLTHFAVMFAGLAIALETLGINLSTLFAAGAVFAIGLGFAMQNIAQNFVSGVILLAEQSIKPGDVVSVDGNVVRVREMRVRTTIAVTRDDEELIIPNSYLVQNTVKNYTLQDSLYRVRAVVGVLYSSDMRLVQQTLERVATEIPWRSPKREPRVLLTEFGDSAVNFAVSVWMDDPWEAPRSLSRLNEDIWWALKDAGITIAFPQLDVHLDPPVLASLQADS